MNNIVNTLYQDLQNNTTWQTEYSNFCTNLANQVLNNLQQLTTYWSGATFYNWLQNNLTNCITGCLQYWTYAYDTQTLLAWWTNNMNQIALDMVINFTPYFIAWCNAISIMGNENIINTLIDNQLATTSTNTNSNYHVQSALNSNSNLTIQNINSQGTNNSAMSSDTTPLKDSNGDFNNTSTNNVDNLQIANIMMNSFKEFNQNFKKVLYETFKDYLLPFNDIDNNVEGFNW